MEVLVGALVGAVVGVAITGLLHPMAERLERFSRRLWRVRPLFVHIEADRRLIWAGSPPWIPAAVWLPEMPREQPPLDANDWSAWGRRLGGHDADVTMLQVTLQARKDVSLVVDRPMIRYARSDDRRGVIALCPVGGADLLPRRIDVDLDTFDGDVAMTQHLDYDEEVPWPSISLAPGEVERLHIWAKASSGFHQWRLELPVLVDGRRRLVPVDNAGDAFTTVGFDGIPKVVWIEGHWEYFEVEN